MANVGGRQLTLGACGLTKFAETADGRKVQLHIPKYVQGPVGRACRYADRGCPFRSQRGTALSSHERSCKKQPPPVVPALGAPPPAAPAIAAPPIMMNNNAEEDVVMESVEEEKKEEPCPACSFEKRLPGEAHGWAHTCKEVVKPVCKVVKLGKDGVQKKTKGAEKQDDPVCLLEHEP